MIKAIVSNLFKMPKKIDPKILYAEIKARIRESYPYFIGFYIFSLVVSIFSSTWSSFFYWPAFHISAVVFSLLMVLSLGFGFILDFGLGPVGLAKKNLHRLFVFIRRCLIYLRFRLLHTSRRTWLKILFISALLVFAVFKNVVPLDLLVLFYALISLLFILDSRWSAATALVLLAVCPVFLIFKKYQFAENVSIYAYYFLAITVLTQIIEVKREKLLVDNSGSYCGQGIKKVV